MHSLKIFIILFITFFFFLKYSLCQNEISSNALSHAALTSVKTPMGGFAEIQRIDSVLFNVLVKVSNAEKNIESINAQQVRTDSLIKATSTSQKNFLLQNLACIKDDSLNLEKKHNKDISELLNEREGISLRLQEIKKLIETDSEKGKDEIMAKIAETQKIIKAGTLKVLNNKTSSFKRVNMASVGGQWYFSFFLLSLIASAFLIVYLYKTRNQ